jgi:hypothetical protein
MSRLRCWQIDATNWTDRVDKPLLVIDGDSFAHRAFHGLPKTIRRSGNRGGGAIVGFANFLLPRQGILRRMARQRIEVITLSEPRWSDACADGRIEIVNVYNRDVRVIEDLALLTYATTRVPDDDLAAPLRAAGITVVAAGDTKAPQEMLFATASGHAAGEAV